VTADVPGAARPVPRAVRAEVEGVLRQAEHRVNGVADPTLRVTIAVEPARSTPTVRVALVLHFADDVAPGGTLVRDVAVAWSARLPFLSPDEHVALLAALDEQVTGPWLAARGVPGEAVGVGGRVSTFLRGSWQVTISVRVPVRPSGDVPPQHQS